MVTPISNDKLPTFNSTKAGNPGAKSTTDGREGPADSGGTPETVRPAGNRIDIERAGELYRSTASGAARPAGNLDTPEEAAQLAARTGRLLTADGAQALRAQAGAQASQVDTLLSTAP